MICKFFLQNPNYIKVGRDSPYLILLKIYSKSSPFKSSLEPKFDFVHDHQREENGIN